jgi:hypothetical protein
MEHEHTTSTDPEEPRIYHIRLKGHLRAEWAAWFDDARITHEANGETLLTCTVVDQAALYGLLKKVRDLGLPLLAVVQVEPD